MNNSTQWPQALRISTASGWSAEEVSAHLHELVEVIDMLAEKIPASSVGAYLTDPHGDLNGENPLALIREGQCDRVLAALAH